MLMRVFLGWLRGECGYDSMVAVPTTEEEDAKRPSRERENQVDEQTRVTNRLKAALARLGIRGFNPKLRKAPQQLESLQVYGRSRLDHPEVGAGNNCCERERYFRPHRNGHGCGAVWYGNVPTGARTKNHGSIP
jgi:hypothetical protein